MSDPPAERAMITAVTYYREESEISLSGVANEPGAASRVFSALAAANCNVDLIVQGLPSGGGGAASISFTVRRRDLDRALGALAPVVAGMNAQVRRYELPVGRVTIVGAGLRSHPEVAAVLFSALGEADVNIRSIATSPIQIACLVLEEDVPAAVRVASRAFGLSEADARVDDPY